MSKKIYNNFKNKVWLNMLLIAIVIVGAINWGTTALGYNLVKSLNDSVNQYFKSDYPIDKSIYIIVALAGILLAVKRDTWLPFLGDTVMPESLVPLKVPEKSDKNITIITVPKSKVAYWSASGKDKDQDVFSAYGSFTNSGVVMSDATGKAVLPILEGAGYKVPSNRKIPRHVHYRVLGTNAIMSPVETIYF